MPIINEITENIKNGKIRDNICILFETQELSITETDFGKSSTVMYQFFHPEI